MKIGRLFTLVLIILITYSCKTKKPENFEEMARRSSHPEAVLVKTIKLEPSTFFHELISNGKVWSSKKAVVPFRVNGIIKQITVINGQNVKAGELLGIVMDTLGNLIKTKDRSNPKFSSGWSGKSGLYYFNNNLYYWNVYNDTVFAITPDLIWKATFLIGKGEYRLPRKELNPHKLSQYMLIQTIFETNNYIMIRYYLADKHLFVIIEKNRWKSFVYNLNNYSNKGIINDLDGGPDILPVTIKDDNTIVALIDALQLKKHVSSDAFINSTPKYPEKKKELDNPVLILVRLKE